MQERHLTNLRCLASPHIGPKDLSEDDAATSYLDRPFSNSTKRFKFDTQHYTRYPLQTSYSRQPSQSRTLANPATPRASSRRHPGSSRSIEPLLTHPYTTPTASTSSFVPRASKVRVSCIATFIFRLNAAWFAGREGKIYSSESGPNFGRSSTTNANNFEGLDTH
ncbi:hypothetical protein DL93DRAFT_1180010 [Clavulina sp. PMI_390]|nr:hypothetical protein DL93DRAFT_1180010 [Clavulina sp. PMI_390]